MLEETTANPSDQTTAHGRPFRLELPWGGRLGKALAPIAAAGLEMLCSLRSLDDLYQRVSSSSPADRRDFLGRTLAELGASYQTAAQDLARIPRTGPVMVVANHPFGALEGIVLAHLLTGVRQDVKIMANFLLGRIPELRDLFFFVDPFGSKSAARDNVKPLVQCLRHLEGGGMLAVFPSGEVSHLDLKQRKVIDPPWTEMIGRIVRKNGCPVVPIFFNGHNGALFQLLGLVHPRLRTAALPRQLLNKRNLRMDVRIGSAIPNRKLADMPDDAGRTQYLRERTYMLQLREAPGTARPGQEHAGQPIVAAEDPQTLADEIAALPAAAKLVDGGDCHVYIARAWQIPRVMRELGRLRETTFRATGEGTGKPIDLDQFDGHYLHLFVWDHQKREIVGAYRLGPSDEILAERGVAGLYTYELFDYSRELLNRVGPALEMGRSFVRDEYQRSFTPLLLLWKGIGAYMAKNLRYTTLFGPVSISAAYQSTSKELMVRFLKANHWLNGSERLVTPRNPYKSTGGKALDQDGMATLPKDADDLSDIVSDLEADMKGVPILVKQYLKLGAKFLSFNVDRQFSDVVDGLIVVDLRHTEPRLLGRYMGKEQAAAYLAHHGVLSNHAG